MADGVKTLLSNRMAALLEAACVTALAANDPQRVGAIAVGGYTSDPLKDRLVIVLYDSHPLEDVRWMNEYKDHQADLGYEIPHDFIGGKRSDCLRGTIAIQTNFSRTKESEAEAMAIRQAVLGRAKQALEDGIDNLRGFADDFGESVIDIVLSRNPEYRKVGANYTAYIDWSAWTIR